MARRDWDQVRAALDAFLAGSDRARLAAGDPVAFPRRYKTKADREVAGLVAASLAFGRVASIRAKIGDALKRMGPSPAAYVDALEPKKALEDFRTWRHRMAGPRDLVYLLSGIRKVRETHGSLGKAFAEAARSHPGDPQATLGAFVDGLLAADPKAVYGRIKPGPGFGNLLAHPKGGGPCKRLNLYLRWMLRPEDGVDLGVWDAVPPSTLIIPLDTHIHRIGRYVGFTRLKTPRWETAAEITSALARLDPADPLKYDLALCHLGIAGDCPRHRVEAICARCGLREICRLPTRRPKAPAPATRAGS